MPLPKSNRPQNRKRACILTSVGSRLCALSVWLVAQYHFQLCYCHTDFLAGLRLRQHKIVIVALEKHSTAPSLSTHMARKFVENQNNILFLRIQGKSAFPIHYYSRYIPAIQMEGDALAETGSILSRQTIIWAIRTKFSRFILILCRFYLKIYQDVLYPYQKRSFAT